MKMSRFEKYRNIKKSIIKDVRNVFRLKKLKKETNYAAIKSVRNLFRLKRKIKQFKTE